MVMRLVFSSVAECVFCGIVAGSVSAFTVAAEPAGVAFLDTRPVFPGHVLVIPRPHLITLLDLPASSLAGYFGFVQRITDAVQKGLDADGSFVAMNNVISQSVPHLHCHRVRGPDRGCALSPAGRGPASKISPSPVCKGGGRNGAGRRTLVPYAERSPRK